MYFHFFFTECPSLPPSFCLSERCLPCVPSLRREREFRMRIILQWEKTRETLFEVMKSKTIVATPRSLCCRVFVIKKIGTSEEKRKRKETCSSRTHASQFQVLVHRWQRLVLGVVKIRFSAITSARSTIHVVLVVHHLVLVHLRARELV